MMVIMIVYCLVVFCSAQILKRILFRLQSHAFHCIDQKHILVGCQPLLDVLFMSMARCQWSPIKSDRMNQWIRKSQATTHAQEESLCRLPPQSSQSVAVKQLFQLIAS